MNSRLEKLERIRKKNIEVYPRDFPGRVTIEYVLVRFKQLHDKYIINNIIPPLIKDEVFKIAGRIIIKRDHGNNIFFVLMDQTGEIQLHAKKKDKIGEAYITNYDIKTWSEIQECDLGDMVGVEGTLGQNRSGEPLLVISNWTLLAKALIEPPDKHHGITEPEIKYRHRERDLLSSPDSRALFKTRAEIIFEIRKYLNARDFIEIETPILQSIYGGATARPFITKHNSLGQNYYLSISSELFLKRALVGGYDRVYSISRCFRNEGISPEHNPEFTNLEIFETCKTSDDMEVFTDDLLNYIAHSIGSLLPLTPPMRFDRFLSASDWPLSRTVANKESDSWELYINDMEIASGASDLNDPHEQENRLKESERKSEQFSEARYSIESSREEEGKLIDYNAQYDEKDIYDPYDKNYIEALECGALPWAGVGIGIDRLVMLLTEKTNIRDVILFPTLKNKN